MSRKKIKKDVVKRKTNIYDPMGVYGRGLTKNQKLGMTRRMKVENIRDSEPPVTEELLKKYQEILIYYGIQTIVPLGHVETIPISFQFTDLYEIDDSNVMPSLINLGITPKMYFCDTFVITRMAGTSAWNTTLWYMVFVGNSSMLVQANRMNTTITANDTSVTIPRYFKYGTDVQYYNLHYDNDASDMFIRQETYQFGPYETHVDFDNLPDDGSPIPYLLYPNTVFPNLKIQVGMQDHDTDYYLVTVFMTVIY